MGFGSRNLKLILGTWTFWAMIPSVRHLSLSWCTLNRKQPIPETTPVGRGCRVPNFWPAFGGLGFEDAVSAQPLGACGSHYIANRSGLFAFLLSRSKKSGLRIEKFQLPELPLMTK